MRNNLAIALVLVGGTLPAQDSPRVSAVAVRRLTTPLVREEAGFRYRIEAKGKSDALIVIQRDGDDSAVTLRSRWANADFRRTPEHTELALPDHGVVFVSEGPVGADSIAPEGFLERLLGPRSILPGLLRANAHELLGNLGRIDTIDDGVTISTEPGKRIAGEFDRISLTLTEPVAAPATRNRSLRTVRVARAEIERMCSRALRRALEIGLPQFFPTPPPRALKVANGALRVVGGQRVALLEGTPRQIGRAHGRLLAREARALIDSCLYLVGLVETVRSGKWFPAVLDDAWARLSPYIPDRHHEEMRALADAIDDLSLRELQLGNVFPEYFHCSGFAVFGSATKDGTLYHGRVLDYMTVIGLQRASVNFVVRPRGHHSFLNVGYAGFVGSVTGMNDQKISLGEMGGKGRGKWDGVPMATLMRRGLEECSTLAEVKSLFETSKRTCEYYYVFADGKGPTACGVAATPEAIEFIEPGRAHERLGPGIPDTVVLSAGSRLRQLRERIAAGHGKLDAQAAIRLMDRPVAMSSNLHNALLVPAKGVAYIANASASEPAATQPYVELDFRALSGELGPVFGSYEAKDSLTPKRDDSDDARAMLGDFGYEPASFSITVENDPGEWDAIVTFPSPKPRGDPRNDTVPLEWYAAKGRDKHSPAPAMLVIHILAGRMQVARAFARGLSRQGVHAFVIHLPDYGRRGDRDAQRDVSRFTDRVLQGVADARRARDVIAALPDIDTSRIGVQGTSLGAFVASLAGALDGGFDAVFLALAGGDLYEILTNGHKDSAKLLRRLRATGLSDERIRSLLHRVEPLRIAHRLDPKRTWLYSARADQVIPKANATKLAERAHLAGHQITLPGNHYTAAVHIPWLLEHMVERIKRPVHR